MKKIKPFHIYFYGDNLGRLWNDGDRLSLLCYDTFGKAFTVIVEDPELLKEAGLYDQYIFIGKENPDLTYQLTELPYIACRSLKDNFYCVFVDGVRVPGEVSTLEGAFLLGISYKMTGDITAARYAAKVLDVSTE